MVRKKMKLHAKYAILLIKYKQINKTILVIEAIMMKFQENYNLKLQTFKDFFSIFFVGRLYNERATLIKKNSP